MVSSLLTEDNKVESSWKWKKKEDNFVYPNKVGDLVWILCDFHYGSKSTIIDTTKFVKLTASSASMRYTNQLTGEYCRSCQVNSQKRLVQLTQHLCRRLIFVVVTCPQKTPQNLHMRTTNLYLIFTFEKEQPNQTPVSQPRRVKCKNVSRQF